MTEKIQKCVKTKNYYICYEGEIQCEINIVLMFILPQIKYIEIRHFIIHCHTICSLYISISSTGNLLNLKQILTLAHVNEPLGKVFIWFQFGI